MEVDRHLTTTSTLSPLDSEEITTLLRAEIECQNQFLCIQNTVSMIPYGYNKSGRNVEGGQDFSTSGIQGFGAAGNIGNLSTSSTSPSVPAAFQCPLASSSLNPTMNNHASSFSPPVGDVSDLNQRRRERNGDDEEEEEEGEIQPNRSIHRNFTMRYSNRNMNSDPAAINRRRQDEMNESQNNEEDDEEEKGDDDDDYDQVDSDPNSTEDEDLEVDLESSLGEDDDDEEEEEGFYSERDDEDIQTDEVRDGGHRSRSRDWKGDEEFHSPIEGSDGEVEIEINSDRHRGRSHFLNRRINTGEESFQRGNRFHFREQHSQNDDDDDDNQEEDDEMDEMNDIEDDLETTSSEEG